MGVDPGRCREESTTRLVLFLAQHLWLQHTFIALSKSYPRAYVYQFCQDCQGYWTSSALHQGMF